MIELKSKGKNLMIQFAFLLIFQIFFSSKVYAACGATNITWNGSGSTAWNTAANWTPANAPNVATENAIIVSAARIPAANTVTVGCVDVQSGSLQSTNARTITVTGDYFKAINSGSLSVTATHTSFIISLAGTAAQSFQVVDPVNNVTITNNTTVNFTNAFTIRNNLTLSGTTTTLNINENLNMTLTTGTLTIPAGVTVNIAANKTLFMSGNIVVNGTLRLNPGAQIQMDPTKSITVNSGGQLRLEGASGSVASIVGNGGYYNLAVAGSLYANYFRFDKVGNDLKGVSVTGTISSFDNGEIHYINNNGYGVTLGAAASVPATINNLSFFDDANNGTARNFDASLFNVSNVQMEGWSGLGSSKENDPNNRINWGTQAGTVLTLSQNTNVSKPTDPTVAGAAEGEFIIYSFALNQASTATDITSVKLTLIGSGNAGDIDYVRLYKQGASCQTLGAAIGSTQTMSGTPATTTFTIPAATLTISNTTAVCLHVYVKTTSSAVNNNTIGISIESTTDVTNSQGYSFSPTSGPPVQSGLATISGSTTSVWDGSSSTAWATNANWTPATAPTATQSCTIGTGANVLTLTANQSCLNVTFSTGGSINWNSGAWTLTTLGSLNVNSGFTFTNATAGTITFGGSSNQTMSITTAFPGNVIINNSGGVSKIISVSSNSTINGNLTITSGTLLIPSGVTLTVLGNVVVQTGTVLSIQGGGTLKLANTRSLTVNLGGTLELLGSTSNAVITSNIGTAAYNVVINGTIKADKYNFDHLNTTGVTINSGATIDATYNLSNGAFTYPVNNSTTLLRLFKAIPGNTLNNVQFDSSGSVATTITNIYTDATIGAGTLTMNSYTGDLAGPALDNPNTYLINWAGAGNKIVVAQAATSPATVNQGQVGVVMGRFAFSQQDTGSTDTDLTSLTLTLTGTGAASYVDTVKVYYDSDCDSAAGTLIGTGTFSGAPATVTFSSITGATIPSSLVSPPTRCIYVTYDISSTAVNASTLGVKLNQSSHMVDSQNYGASNSVSFPVTLGTASSVIGTSTTWTGAVSTAWTTAGNWNGGVPTSSLNCIINSAANNPIISTGTQSCNSITIGTGNLTINTGTILKIYGALSNSGTINNSGSIELTDNGSTVSNHVLTLGSTNIANVNITNTIGGTISIGGSSASITGLTLSGSSASSYTFLVDTNKTLTLPSGATINGGTFKVNSAGIVKVGNTQTILMSGGELWLNGTSEAYPQNLATKAKMTVNTSGTWGLNATGGNLKLGGFNFDYLNTNGLVIGGSATLSAFHGGQFTNLSNSYSSVKVVQVNTTGSIPATATNVGFNWKPNNTTPASTDAYKILFSSGCSNQSMDFTGWFGDWADDVNTFDVTTKISNTNCNLTLSGMATAVSLLSFSADSYKNGVQLKWETIKELDHQGFNVFRGIGTGSLVQLNERLIRNIENAGSFRAKYEFIDRTAIQGLRYTYFIQDVSIAGHTKMHGPVFAMVKEELDPLPETDYGDNSDSRDTDIPGSNLGYQNLGDGIELLTMTNSNLRLRVKVPEISFNLVPYDLRFKQASLVGYGKMLKSGSPELLEKIILVEVPEDISEVKVLKEKINQRQIVETLIQPAPKLSLVNGKLVNNFYLDEAVYLSNSKFPSSFYELQKDVEEINGRKYLKLKLLPLIQDFQFSTIAKLDELVLDIGLNEGNWTQAPPRDDSNNAYNSNNSLLMDFNETGMYEVSFGDLVAANVDGPFEGIEISKLRVYHLEEEIPIEITSEDQYFNSNDKVRFYLIHSKYEEGVISSAVLSMVDFNDHEPLRVKNVDGSILGKLNSNRKSSIHEVTTEKNLVGIFSSPVGEGLDHFYEKQIFYPTVTGPSDAIARIEIVLNNHDSLSSSYVEIDLYLKGLDVNSVSPRHHLSLFVNNIIAPVGDIILEDQEANKVQVKLPANYFFNGKNIIRLSVLGDLIPPGSYDIVFLDKTVVRYPRIRVAENNFIEINNNEKNKILDISGIATSAPLLYDVSKYNDTKRVVNYKIEPDQSFYRLLFNANNEDDILLSKKYVIHSIDNFKKVHRLSLINSGTTLKERGNHAEFVIVGQSEIKSVLDDYLKHKKMQGLDVKFVDVEKIFREFDFGRKSPEAIKNFINYAIENWTGPKLKYVMLIGDTSYDPKNYLGFGNQHNRIPSKLVRGNIYDYNSDHWYTTVDSSLNLPQVSIGRIPSNSLDEISNYLEKVIAYENGDWAPSDSKKQSISFFNTISDSLEDFEGTTKMLSEHDVFKKNNISTEVNSHKDTPLNTFNKSIKDAFYKEHLFINYNGHGAEDRWGRGNGDIHLDNEIAKDLKNSKLPIVVALNCLNTNFYSAAESDKSLSEILIFKKAAGAIAFVGSSAMTTTVAQINYITNFYNHLDFTSGSYLRLGDMFLKSKIAFEDQIYMKDILYSYHLIGDPTLIVLKKRDSLVQDLNPQPNQSENSSGKLFSCSAHANTGNDAPQSAVIELLFLGLILFIARRIKLS